MIDIKKGMVGAKRQGFNRGFSICSECPFSVHYFELNSAAAAAAAAVAAVYVE